MAKAPEQAVRAEDAVPRVAALPCAGRGCGALGPDRVSVGPARLLSAGQEAVRVRVRAVPALARLLRADTPGGKTEP